MITCGLCVCSNGLNENEKPMIDDLSMVLRDMGFSVRKGDVLYDRGDGSSADPKVRADIVNNFFSMPDMNLIFDISGGDLCNEILPYLNSDIIKASDARFCGYSDLTVILNAMYKMTGRPQILFQVKSLMWSCAESQRSYLKDFLQSSPKHPLMIHYDMIQGERMEGILIGGNIRCLLKLSGTPYQPDFKDKILFLEGMGGYEPQIRTYFAQLKLMGALLQVKGIVLGTFTKLMKRDGTMDAAIEIANEYAPDIPIAVTREVGHGPDMRALWIGGYYRF